ncbi:MAG TPA: class I SAM-dependent methyltransferase, partial [Streptosporangiaceae bacterium]
MPPESHSTRARNEGRAGQVVAARRMSKAYNEVFRHKQGQLAAGEWLIERLHPGARVLDVGCGTGVPTARQLADAGCEVTGIDSSAELLEVAKREVPEATFRRVDIADTPDVRPSRRGFDAIVAFFSLLKLPRADIPAMLQRLHDLLEPGAYFLLSMVETDLGDVPSRLRECPLRANEYPGAQLRTLVGEAGFEVLDLRHLSYAPASPRMPPDVQLFVYCRRPRGRLR